MKPTLFHMNQNPRHFGEYIAGRLAGHGDLRELAAATRIPLTTLHRRLHSANMDDFKLGELVSIADLLGITTGALVTEYERGDAA